MQVSSNDIGTLGTGTTLKVNPSSCHCSPSSNYKCGQCVVSHQLHGACSLPSEHLSTEQGLCLRFRALEGDALWGGCFSSSNTPKASYTRRCLQSTHPTNKTHFTIAKARRGSRDISLGNWSCQQNQIMSCGADPEVLMKKGNKRQLFSLRTLSPPLCERALSNASFSWASACVSSPPGSATPIGQTDLSSLEL